MRFRVLKQFDWADQRYPKGVPIEIHEQDPKLGMMIKSGLIVYDWRQDTKEKIYTSILRSDIRGNPVVSEGRERIWARNERIAPYR